MHDHAGSANNLLYPFRIYSNGRLGGPCTLFTESEKARTEWHRKLQEALGLRRVIMESNKVFEMDALSQDMFLVPSAPNAPVMQPLGDASVNGGRITCSVPFGESVMIIFWTIFTIRMKVMPDGRKLVAFGCGEGIWIGFMYDPRSKWLYLSLSQLSSLKPVRHVIHLPSVTQCAILEDFGIFLVLADKMLLAYHIEALVPSQPNSSSVSLDPQRLNPGAKDVQFFTIGTMHNRTLVIYARKKGVNILFPSCEQHS